MNQANAAGPETSSPRVTPPADRDGPAHSRDHVATRYDKLAVRYEATLHVAAINEWLLLT